MEPKIQKGYTKFRKSVSAEERLRYLTTEKNTKDLEFRSVISLQLLRQLIPETYLQIFEVLKNNA